jgi:hypothetical protein
MLEHGLEGGDHFFLWDLAKAGGDDPMVPKGVTHASGSVAIELIRERIDFFCARAERLLEHHIGVRDMQIEDDRRSLD